MSAERIRKLNDEFRTTMNGGNVMMTAGIHALPSDVRAITIRRVATFSDFNNENDPHGEHDFGVIEEGEARCFWKIDYYDREMELISPDPSDPAVTTRVLTIMLADEY